MVTFSSPKWNKINYFFILLPFFVVTLRGNDILRQILFLKRGKMTTNFYSTNQFLYEPKLLFRNLKSRDDFWRDFLYSSRNHLALSSTCLTGYAYPRQVKVLQAHGFRNYFYNFCFLWSALQNLWWRCWSGLCWRYQNHNSQVSYFHNRTVPTPYYIRQSGKDTEETQASRSRVPEETYQIEKQINNYLLIINFILTGKRWKD